MPCGGRGIWPCFRWICVTQWKHLFILQILFYRICDMQKVEYWRRQWNKVEWVLLLANSGFCAMIFLLMVIYSCKHWGNLHGTPAPFWPRGCPLVRGYILPHLPPPLLREDLLPLPTFSRGRLGPPSLARKLQPRLISCLLSSSFSKFSKFYHRLETDLTWFSSW